MSARYQSKRWSWPLSFLLGTFIFASLAAHARPFVISGSTIDLVDVTSNVNVYYTEMRYNRAANEWDVNVTLSNNLAQANSAPMLLVVDSFSGTSGPLRADGVSSNEAYYDFSPELAQGQLAGLQESAVRVISFGFTPGSSPHFVTSVYALASTNLSKAIGFTQSQDQVGAPLPSVAVLEMGPDGTTNYTTDPAFGIVTLGTSAGNYTWMFTSNGYLPVWRQAQLQSNTVTVIPYPRLVALNSQTNTFSPLTASGVTNQAFQAQFAAGAFSQNTSAQITTLDGQTLPFPLPQGWSPMQAFAIQFSSEPSQGTPIQVSPWGFIAPDVQTAFAKFNSSSLTWQVSQLAYGGGTNALSATLTGSGTYVLSMPDAAPIAPPAPTVGAALQPSVLASPAASNMIAGALVTPTTSPASTVPESVTAVAQVNVTNLANPLPSGLWFRGAVTETFDLLDGTLRTPQIFDTYFLGYQQPGGAGAGTLQAQFPVRPELILGPDQLNEGTVHVDVFAADAFAGGVFDTNGGLVDASPVGLLAGIGAFPRPEGVELRAVNPTNFVSLPGSNFTVAASFEVEMAGINPGSELALQVTGLSSNATFVLGQVIDQPAVYGVTPLARMHTDTNGNLINDEPTNADHLPGLTGSGQFVLLQVAAGEGLVEGTADNSTAQPTVGLPVSVSGLPWITLSGAGGFFQTLAPAGSQTLLLTNAVTGDIGSVIIAMPATLPTIQTSIGTGAGQLTVTSVTPFDGETNVPQITPILINFSRPIAAGTFDSNSVTLIENSNEVVATTAELNLAGTTVTLLTVDQLDAGAQFQIVLATNLADANGRTLAGSNTFSFSTEPAATRDPAAQLIIYQPGATNLESNIVANLPGYVPGSNSTEIVVQGTPGCADPDVPVVIMNEGTGETSTVTSQDDGSFVSFINGQAQDFISATFFSQNGVRLYIPVNRQIFDDGSVGLYQQGGSLTASGDGGPIQITVPPNAIASRTIFKLNSVTTNELAAQLGGVMPTNGTVAGSALNLGIQGQAPTLPVQVSFPVDLTSLGFPTNEEATNAAAVVTVVQSNQNVISYQIMNQLTFTPQSAQSQISVPFNKKFQPHLGADATGALEASLAFLPGGADAQFVFSSVIVPLLLGPRAVTVEGECAYVPLADVLAGEQSAINAVGQVGGLFSPAILGAAQIADYALDAAELNASLPLDGAFVTATQSGGPLNAEPGRLFPGMVYATSGSDGTYLTVVPQGSANYLITASHPSYKYPLTIPITPASFTGSDISLAGAVYKNFFFSVPVSVLTPPHVSIANTPVQPVAGQPCTVQVTAYQPSAAPAVGVKIAPQGVGTVNLLTGQTVTNTQPALTVGNISTNGTTTTWTGTLTCTNPISVSLQVVVQGQNASQDIPNIPYVVQFSGNTPPVPTTIPPPPTNDTHGPVVVQTDPLDNGFIGNDDTITVVFDKPIDGSATNNTAGIQLSGPGTPLTPILRLSPDQTTLQLEYPGLQANSSYALTLSGQSIRDLAAHPLNQVPSSTTAVSFTTTFRTPPTSTATLPDLANGRGAVISGTELYAIDQAPSGNYLDAYDISDPTSPSLDSQLPLLGMPRDLVVIPQYGYVTNIHSQGVTNDLVVVVGGDLDAQISSVNSTQDVVVTEPGQYLWVVNMGDPTSPQVLASPIVTYRVGSVVPKIRWAPPNLIYEEYGSDIQQLVVVNLQAMIIGFNATPLQEAAFPTLLSRGNTTNADGSYIGAGDTFPLPGTLTSEFYGYDTSYVLQGTTQPILDFSAADGGALVGITLRNGLELNNQNLPDGTSLLPMYRTLVDGSPLNIATPTDAAFPFTSGSYPRWVTVFGDLSIMINGSLTTRSIALVSLAPDSDGVDKLAVLDISLPEKPVLLNSIPFPQSLLGGDIQSVSMAANGLLQVAGPLNVLLVDPTQLAAAVPAGQLSPAIVGTINGAGGITRSLGSSAFGIYGTADSGHNEVVQTAPQLQFVSFPQNNGLIDPSVLYNQGDTAIGQLLAQVVSPQGLSPARVQPQPTLGLQSDLAPVPNPALHYYVLVQAPGAAGASIDLGLEGLDPSGWPLGNPGVGFAPVRAISPTAQTAIGESPRPGCGAPIRALPAYRLSADPNSVYYNYYLSRPFALITESMTADDLTTYQINGGVPREILFSGYWLRAFLDPDNNNNLAIGSFAAQADTSRQTIYPLSAAIMPAVNRSYIDGINPPPPAGAVKMPGTFGTVCAQSGELRTEATDLSLPSPRMPIEIKRAIGNQDSYEGPFGVGWDFNYNQRLTVLSSTVFPNGLEMPIVTRDTSTDSVTAGSKDILFHTGLGQTTIFRWISSSMPPEYAQDPLVLQYNYANLVSDYYLPASGQGVFDLLVKYIDGRFERLTPDGVRYRYTSEGKLESILDRYDANSQVLQYDSHGWLVRIDDDSVSGPRYVLFGHYRLQNAAGQATDPDFVTGLDTATTDAYLNGKISTLQDYAGRSVLYQYTSDGFLTNRLGVQVAGENGGYAGRSHIGYVYNGCRLVQILANADGSPLISANNVSGSSGQPVAQSTTGIGNNVQLQIPANNAASSLAGLATSAGLADGSSTQFTFDKLGNPATETTSGAGGASATTSNQFDQNGLLIFVRHPEGNTETMSYDTNNPIFRSRANLLTHAVNPGPRGGVGYTETFQYDPNYNLKSGPQTTPDGFTWNYALTADNRDIASITFGNAGSETFTYNANGQPLSHTDVRGVENSFTYDFGSGFVLTRNLGDNAYTYSYGGDVASQLGQPASLTLPEGAPLQLQYNANLQRVEVTRGSLIEDLGYDEEGHQIYDQTQFGNGQVAVSTKVYDDKGFLLKNVINGVEVNGTPVSLEYDFTPDPLSRIQSILYPEGTTQTYAYDSRGNTTNMTLGDYAESYAYDLNNNRTNLVEGGDSVQTTVYDGLDRPITVIRETGSQQETQNNTYYPGGELQSKAFSDQSFGEAEKETIDQIDELGRPLHRIVTGTTITPTYQETYTPGSSTETGPRMTTENSWNTAGYDTGCTDPILTSVFKPDGNGNLTEIDNQEDGATYNSFFQYDANDNRISTSDDLGNQFQYLPRTDGSVLAITNANGHWTTFQQSVLSELLGKLRQDGMAFQFQHDDERHVSYTGDPSAGFRYAYDQDFRLTNSTLRNGASIADSQFNDQNMPQAATIPGGNATMAYDLQRRLTSKTVNYQSTTYALQQSYDAADRPRVVSYQQDNGSPNTATYTYDEAGPILSAEFKEDTRDFEVQYGYYPDTTRQSITYPSGVTVTETRDTTGRLTGISDANGNIVSVSSWQGNLQPKAIQLGANIQIINQFDVRGRLTATRATRTSDNAVLIHMRYQYDAANNLTERQFLHRSGKADQFAYDTGERLSQAEIATIPLQANSATTPIINRNYNYNLGGEDYLTSTSDSDLTTNIPIFATNWTSHDSFLLPEVVDAFNRGAGDPLGDVATTLLQVRPVGASGTTPLSATLTHNGNSSLETIQRGDGLLEQNYFQPDGLRFERKISNGGQVADFRHYVYDEEGRLLEEYEQTNGTAQLVGRYYYATADAPVAADLFDPGSGTLKRYYYLLDDIESVIAVADTTGTVVERVWYDPFGQPSIELRDTKPPVIQSVIAGSNGVSLMIAMSESVWATNADPGPGTGIVAWPQISTNVFTLIDTDSSSNLTGTVQLLPSVAGYPPYSVFQFTPANPLPTNLLELTLNAGMVADEWGNINTTNAALFHATNQPGAVYYQPQPAPQTAAVRAARSSVGSPFLFHGQYFDYDTGLIYARARFYDPYSGMFLEPDPLGYEDSVNLYAAMDNNPVGSRDPTGLSSYQIKGIENLFADAVEATTRISRKTTTIVEEGRVIAREGEAITREGQTIARQGENLAREARTVTREGEELGRASKAVTSESAPVSRTVSQATEIQNVDKVKQRELSQKVWSLEENQAVGEFAESAGQGQEKYIGLFRRPEEGKKLYRGVPTFVGKKYLENGVVTPRWGPRSMEDHVNRNLTDSKWTSWSTDIDQAKKCAVSGDDLGMVFELDPATLPAQFDGKVIWTFPFSNHKAESEWLIEGGIDMKYGVELVKFK